MTVAVNDTIERYVIAGAGPYPYTWRIFNNTDLQVHALSTASPPVPTLLTYLTHYTVAGVNDSGGGSISLTTAAFTPYAGYTLDIRANTPEDQPTSIRNIARFLPEIHEDAYDYLSRQTQDLDRRHRLSVQLPDNELAPDWATILSVVNRKGKYGLFFNATTGAPELYASIGATTLTQSVIGAFLYPQSPAEVTAGVAPVNFHVPHGWITRYTANVGNNVANDAAGFQAAISQSQVQGGAPVYVPMPTVCWFVNSNLTIVNQRPFKMTGAGPGYTPGGNPRGCMIRVGSGVTAGTALFDFVGFQQGITLADFGVICSATGSNHKAFRFREILQLSMRNIRMEGASSAADDCTGIVFLDPTGTGGTYSGAADLEGLYITNMQRGITIAANCTSISIHRLELYGNNPAAASLVGITLATNCIGVVIDDFYCQGWVTGIQDSGISNVIINGKFETCTTFSYDRLTATFPIGFGNVIVSGVNPRLPAKNGGSGVIDIRPLNWRVDDTAGEFGLGIVERSRTAKMGDWTTYAPAYTGSGTLTFTGVTSTVIRYRLIGNSLKVQWFLAGTVGGAGAEIRIALPAGATAVGRVRGPVFNFEGGAQKFGVAEVQNGDALIRIFKDTAVSGNWTAGGGETYGDIEFLVAGI